MATKIDDVRFPEINTRPRVLVAELTRHGDRTYIPNNNRKYGDTFHGTSRATVVVEAFGKLGIQSDVIDAEQSGTVFGEQDKCLDKVVTEERNCTINANAHSTKNIDTENIAIGIEVVEGHFLTMLNSVEVNFAQHQYSLIVVITDYDKDVIMNKLIHIIRKLPSKNISTPILVDLYDNNNISTENGFVNRSSIYKRVCFPNISTLMYNGELNLYFYKRHGEDCKTFKTSDHVMFCKFAYSLAIGLPLMKVLDILSSKAAHNTIDQDVPFDAVKLVKKCGRVIYNKENLEQLHELITQAGQKIALTTGCFDIFHAGHAAMLNEGKQQADVLIVALNSDNSVRQLKGGNRPICNLEQRMFILLELKSVDFIVVFEEKRPDWIIDILNPHVFVKGPEYTAEALKKSFPQLEHVHIAENRFDIHTSTIVDACRKK